MTDIKNSYVLKLEDANRSTPDIGNTAAYLGDLMKAGLNGVTIQPGFVVNGSAHDKFMKMNRLESKIRNLINNVDLNEIHELSNVSNQIQNLIIQAQFPEGVENEIKEEYEELSVGKEVKEVGGIALDMIKAGRSQAFVSVNASVIENKNIDSNYKSVFNVRGPSIINAIKECWASLFTPHAIFYRKTKKLDTIPKTAIIIQKMLESEKCGTVFTSYPIKTGQGVPDMQALLIEASWGLGEMITTGSVTPDGYAIDKESGSLIEKKINKKLYMKKTNALSGRIERDNVPREQMSAEVLDSDEIKKLWSIAREIEEHYGGRSQIIEWCKQRHKFFIIQSRPMPPMKMKNEMVPEVQISNSNKAMLSGISACTGMAKGKVKFVLDPNDFYKVQKGDIVVTKIPDSALIPVMERAGAIVSDFGGRTCALATISREIGLPVVTGTEIATSSLQEDQNIIVDAINGKIYSQPEPESEICAQQVQPDQHPHMQQTQPQSGFMSETVGHPESMPNQSTRSPYHNVGSLLATEVKVSLSFPEPANTDTSDGVGLMRAEHLLTSSGRHPLYLARTTPEELVQNIVASLAKVAKAYYPKQVWYRAMNARTDEIGELEGGGEEKERNPIIGWRGIRRSLEQPEVFRCEIEAIKRLYQEGLNNIAIALPFVSKISELRKVSEIIASVFNINGQAGNQPLLGVIIETPAAAIEIESFCKEGIEFVSIDLDTLTQLILAVDNGNPKTSVIYSETDPAVINIIRHVISTCNKYRVKTSAFGEATNNPRVIDILVSLGIGSISAESDTFQQVKEIVARSEKKILLDRARNSI